MSKKMNKYVYAAAALGMLLGTVNPSLVNAVSNEDATMTSQADTAEKTSETSSAITEKSSSETQQTETQQSETTTSETTEQSTTTDSSTQQSTEQTTEQTTDQTTAADTDQENSQAAVNDNAADKAEIAKIGKGDKFNPDLFLKFTERKLHEAYDSVQGFYLKVFKLKGEVDDLISPENIKERFDVAPETVNHLVAAYFMYDAAFAKDSVLFSLLALADTAEMPNTGFYPNTEQLEGTTLNHEDGQMMTVKSYYVDQKSDKTVIIHGGVRGNWTNGIVSDEYKNFYDAGYNLLFVDSRASGASGGDYITYGAYESDDVLYWVNRESRERPQQKILLYGGSMGAATMMSTLAKDVPSNVKGIIENCGFKSINEQLRFTYQTKIAPALMNLFDKLDVAADQAHEDMYMSMLQQYYNDPYVKIDLTQDLPVIGMTNSAIPKLIIHGSADTVVPVSNASALYDLASGYKDLLIVEGADHGKAQEVDPAAYDQHVTDFLKVVFEDHVQVRYQDEQGENLLKEDCLVLSGTYGEPYKTEEKNFAGYKLLSVDGPTEGTFNEKVPTITYIYQKEAVKPDDNSGNSTNKDNSSGTKDDTTKNDTSKTEPVKDETPNVQNISKTNVKVQENKPVTATKGSSTNNLPKTGDTTHPVLMITGGVISAAAVLFWFFQARKGLKK